MFAVKDFISLRKQVLNSSGRVNRTANKEDSLRKQVLKETYQKQKPDIEQEILFQNLGTCPIELIDKDGAAIALAAKEHKIFSMASKDLVYKVGEKKYFIGTFKKPGNYCIVGSAKRMGDLVDGKSFPLHVFYKNSLSGKPKDKHWQPIAKYTPSNISVFRDEWFFSDKKNRQYHQILDK